MKIRNGFVSNSSSSSFVLIMKEISAEDIRKIDTKNTAGIFARGDDFGEGIDFFRLNCDMENFVFKHYADQTDDNPTALSLYLVYWKSKADITDVINKGVWAEIGALLPKKNVTMDGLEISHHSTDCLRDLKDRYFPDVIDEDEERQKELDAYNKLKEDAKIAEETSNNIKKALKEKRKN